MSVDIGAVISRAYQTVIRHKVLWGLGFIVALLSSTGNSNFRIEPDWRVKLFDVDITPEMVILFIVGILLASVVIFLLRAALDAGLIAAGDASFREQPPTLGEAWKTGRARMWPVAALNLVFAGFVALVVILTALLAGATVAAAVGIGLLASQANNQIPEAWGVLPAVGIGIFGLLVLVVVVVPLLVGLAVITQLAQRAAVLENQGVWQAWSTGWRLVRANKGSSALLVLVQLAVNAIIGIIALLIVGPIIGIPVVMLASTDVTVTPALLAGIIGLVLVAWLVSGIVLALPTAWNSTLWTLFYRAATVGLPQASDRTRPYVGPLPPTVPGNLGR